MSLNLQNGVEAARKLHLSAGDLFGEVRDSLLEQARKAMNFALECEHEGRADAIGYARGLRDVWHALESAATGLRHNQVEKPGPVAPKGKA